MTETATQSRLVSIDPERVMPFRGQPRKRFRGIPQLAESIKLIGQMTPIKVTELLPTVDRYEYELIDGERRLAACKTARVNVLAVVEQASADRFVESVAANFCRQEHDTAEIVEAIAKLHKAGKSYREIAILMGKSVAWVSQHAGLRRLIPEAFAMLRRDDEGKCLLTFSIALMVAGLNPAQQKEVISWIARTRPKLVQAQTFIHRYRAERGITPERRLCSDGYTRNRLPKQFDSLAGTVTVVRQRLDRYVAMPHAGLVSLVKSGHKVSQEALLTSAKAMADDAAGLVQALEQIIASGGQ